MPKKTLFILAILLIYRNIAFSQGNIGFLPLTKWLSKSPFEDLERPKAVPEAEINTLLRAINQHIIAEYIDTAKIQNLSLKLLDTNNLSRYRHLWPQELAYRLEQDLILWSGDKHFRVIYHELPLQVYKNSQHPKWKIKHNSQQAYYNFEALELYDQKLAYIHLKEFATKEEYIHNLENHTPLKKVFKWAEPSQIIVIDLRTNLGGKLKAAADLLAYFLPEKGVNIVGKLMYRDSTNISENIATLRANKKAKKNMTKQIYILIDEYTFSSAEFFTQALQATIKPRIKIVGQRSAGAVHGFEKVHKQDNYYYVIPDISMTDQWGNSIEGIGIEPDILVNPNDAMDTIFKIEKINPKNIKSLLHKKQPKQPTPLTLSINPNFIGNYGRIKLKDSLGYTYLWEDTKIFWPQYTPWKKVFYLDDGNFLCIFDEKEKSLCIYNPWTKRKDCYRKDD